MPRTELGGKAGRKAGHRMASGGAGAVRARERDKVGSSIFAD